MNTELIPALMPDSFSDIESAATSVRGVAQTIQLDLMDGVYVPESTWPFHEPGQRDINDITKGDLALPLWEQLNYELDLMIAKPEEDLDTWLSFGASRIIFHFASVHDWSAIAAIDSVTRNFTEIGVAITIHDDIHEVYQLIDNGTVDFVQFMGIAQVGFQGEPFVEEILEKIGEFKKLYPDVTVSIDGGVSSETIEPLREVGVDRFVSGSGVFGSGVASENVEYLKGYID
jgi:ribulose-phosphate 3-epimerase